MDVMEQIREVETKVLDGVGTTQEKIVELNSQMADRVAGVTPRVTEVTDRVRERTASLTDRIRDRLGDRLPSAPKVEFPAPKALVDNYFGTVSRLTELNHRFADQLLTTWEGVRARSEGTESSGSKATATQATKTPSAKGGKATATKTGSAKAGKSSRATGTKADQA